MNTFIENGNVGYSATILPISQDVSNISANTCCFDDDPMDVDTSVNQVKTSVEPLDLTINNANLSDLSLKPSKSSLIPNECKSQGICNTLPIVCKIPFPHAEQVIPKNHLVNKVWTPDNQSKMT